MSRFALSVLALDDTLGTSACDDPQVFYDATWALLDELHRVMSVWPAAEGTVAEMLGWDPPTADLIPDHDDAYDVPAFLRCRLRPGEPSAL